MIKSSFFITAMCIVLFITLGCDGGETKSEQDLEKAAREAMVTAKKIIQPSISTNCIKKTAFLFIFYCFYQSCCWL